MSRLITHDNIENPGFIDWHKTQHLVDEAFQTQEPILMPSCFVIAQWIVLSKRFNVARAEIPRWASQGDKAVDGVSTNGQNHSEGAEKTDGTASDGIGMGNHYGEPVCSGQPETKC